MRLTRIVGSPFRFRSNSICEIEFECNLYKWRLWISCRQGGRKVGFQRSRSRQSANLDCERTLNWIIEFERNLSGPGDGDEKEQTFGLGRCPDRGVRSRRLRYSCYSRPRSFRRARSEAGTADG